MSEILHSLLIYALRCCLFHTVSSHNLPRFCGEPSWNSTAKTFANVSLVGTEPKGMFIDKQDTIYMANQRDHLIHIWKHNGSLVTLNLTHSKMRPISLVVNEEGDIFVANGESKTTQQILNVTNDFRMMEVGKMCDKLFIDKDGYLYCSSPKSGEILYRNATFNLNSWEICHTYSINGWYPLPNELQGLFIENNSILYICDCKSDEIKTFKLEIKSEKKIIVPAGILVWLQEWWDRFVTTKKLNCPMDIAADAYGNLYVVDRDNHRIVQFLKSGKLKCVIGCDGTHGSASNQLKHPTSINFDTYGNIYVVDTGNDRIQKFSLIHGSCDSSTTSFTTATSERHSTSYNQRNPTTSNDVSTLSTSLMTEGNEEAVHPLTSLPYPLPSSTTYSTEMLTSHYQLSNSEFSTLSTSLMTKDNNEAVHPLTSSPYPLPSSTTYSSEMPTSTYQSSTYDGSSMTKTTPNVSNIDIERIVDTMEPFIPRKCPNASYIGPYCNISQDACTILDPCPKTASCINDPTVSRGYQCIPLSNESDRNPCSPNPCRNNGWCERIDKNVYRCDCLSGWTDVHCDRLINHCENVTCFNGGLCRSSLNDYQCLCLTSSYFGRHCEEIETKLLVRQIFSKSFAYIAIISFAFVFVFVLILDILKYCFGIDPTKDKKRR